MKKINKGLFRDINGKLSTKRVGGIFGLLLITFLSIMKIWYNDISETLIIALSSPSFALLGLGIIEKESKNNCNEE